MDRMACHVAACLIVLCSGGFVGEVGAQSALATTNITLPQPANATAAKAWYDGTVSDSGTMTMTAKCDNNPNTCTVKLLSLSPGLDWRLTGFSGQGSNCSGAPTSFSHNTLVVLGNIAKNKSCTVTIEFHVTSFSYADYLAGVSHAPFSVGFSITSP